MSFKEQIDELHGMSVMNVGKIRMGIIPGEERIARLIMELIRRFKVAEEALNWACYCKHMEARTAPIDECRNCKALAAIQKDYEGK